MTKQQFQENSRTWHLGAHLEALRTDDIRFARELYEQRINELEWFINTILCPDNPENHKNVGQTQENNQSQNS